MNQMQVFNSPIFGQVRTMEEDGKVLFCGTDVARSLGYKEPQKAVRTHCRGVSKMDTPTESGIQQMNFVPEGDVYRLIVRSKLPSAEKFERWVFDEVLPSIRKTGGYGHVDVMSIIQQTATAMMSEFVKQVVPLFQQHEAVPETDEEDVMFMSEPVRKRPRRATSVISRLDSGLRTEIENMLSSGRFTYPQIVMHLEKYGIRISTSSICRYVQRMYGAEA